MRPRSVSGAAKGLGQELFSVVLRLEKSGEIVGMGRVVGDGGTIFVICDMMVVESFQKKGGGTMIMDAIMDYLSEEAPPNSYINLMADVDGFYEKWGFVPSLPLRCRTIVHFRPNFFFLCEPFLCLNDFLWALLLLSPLAGPLDLSLPCSLASLDLL